MAPKTRLAVLLVLLGLALPGAAWAGGDVFGGYSFERSDAVSRHGWGASVAVGLPGPFSLVADVSGHYGAQEGVDRDQLTLMAGPRFSFRRGGSATPFLHALVGLLRERTGFTVLDVTISEEENRFGVLLGGGVDTRVGERWSVRVEGDYERSFREGESRGGFRVSVGAVLRFGAR